MDDTYTSESTCCPPLPYLLDPAASLAEGASDGGGEVVGAVPMDRPSTISSSGAVMIALGTTARASLYFFQQGEHRHCIVKTPFGNLRRVTRQPNEVLISV